MFKHQESFKVGQSNTEWPEDWKSMTPFVLKDWLEDMMDLEKQTSTRANPYELFMESITKNRVRIDWNFTGGPLAHPFLADMAKLKQKWHEVKKLIKESPNFRLREKTLAQNYTKSIVHINCNPDFTHQIKSTLTANLSGIYTFDETVDEVQRIVIAKLAQLADARTFFREPVSKSNKPKEYHNYNSKDDWKQSNKGKAKHKRSSDSSFDSSEAKRQKSTTERICKTCGWTMPAGPRSDGCGSDPRRNTTQSEWKDSEVGKAWLQAGFQRGLPRDTSITLANCVTKKKQWQGETVCIAQLCEAMSLTQELTNFDVCDSLQLTNKRKRRESNSSGLDNAPTLSGKLLQEQSVDV